VVEENCTKALAPTAIFWNPNRRIGGEHLLFVKRRTSVRYAFILPLAYSKIFYVHIAGAYCASGLPHAAPKQIFFICI